MKPRFPLSPVQPAAHLYAGQRCSLPRRGRSWQGVAIGLRDAELLSLTVEGIGWKERRALVRGKGARERIVGFEAKTLLAIQRYHRQAGIKVGPLFRSRTGEPLSQAALYLAIRRCAEQAGIEGLHPHTFRHCTATRLLEAGMQESDVRTLLGWSRGSKMVERYTQSGATERALEARGRVRLVG